MLYNVDLWVLLTVRGTDDVRVWVGLPENTVTPRRNINLCLYIKKRGFYLFPVNCQSLENLAYAANGAFMSVMPQIPVLDCGVKSSPPIFSHSASCSASNGIK